MITMASFGKNGRLGNQLFQYAYLYALSKRLNCQFCIPRLAGLNQFQTTATIAEYTASTYVKESDYCDCNRFAQELYDGSDDSNYWGYFQTEEYFKGYEAQLRNELKLKDEVVKKVDEKWGKFYDRLTAVHVRRGDVVREGNALPLLYYEKAIKQFSGSEFIVISDEPEWCEGTVKANYYSKGFSVAEDLYLMSRCKRMILSSSTLSWWAEWLNPKCEATIAPSRWKDGIKHIYRQHWKLVDL